MDRKLVSLVLFFLISAYPRLSHMRIFCVCVFWDEVLFPDELRAVSVSLATADRTCVHCQCPPVNTAPRRVHRQAVQQLGHHLQTCYGSILFLSRYTHLHKHTKDPSQREKKIAFTWNSKFLGAPQVHVGISFSEGMCWEDTHRGEPPRL